MHRRLLIVAVAAFAVTAAAAGVARAADPTAIPPAPTEFVTDHAGFLSPAYASSLTRELEDYERGTGHQLIVWIDKTTGGVPIEDWAVKAFTAWGIGRKGHDDGVALFIFSEDRRLRIAVGYGLEGAVPDARAGRIIQNDMAPRIRAGDRDGAVKAGVDALIAAIGGAPEPRRPDASRVALIKTGFLGMLVFFVVVFFLARRHPWALFLLGSAGRSRWGGDSNWWGGGGGGWGGGGGGGGFSGGGGSTGGGGASGGW